MSLPIRIEWDTSTNKEIMKEITKMLVDSMHKVKDGEVAKIFRDAKCTTASCVEPELLDALDVFWEEKRKHG